MIVKNHRDSSHGLTLIELLVTIAVLAVVAAIAVPVVTNVVSDTNQRALAQTEADIKAFTDKYSKAGGYIYDPSTGIFSGYIDLNGDNAATADEKIEELAVDLERFSVGNSGTKAPTDKGEINFSEIIDASFKVVDYSVEIAPQSIEVKGWASYAITPTSVEVEGAQGNITWEVSSGYLPSGLSLNPSTGTVFGTPDTAYPQNTVTLEATDENGIKIRQTHSYTISPAPTSSPARVETEAMLGESLSISNISLNGFTQPYSWSITSGVLPDGVSLNQDTGTISGIPAEQGEYNFEITLTDANSLSTSQQHSLTVEASGVYQFSEAIFTPGGKQGRNGPSITEIRSGLSGDDTETWKNDTRYLNASGGIIEWTVPATGEYYIDVYGAGGGGDWGGTGARVADTFTLTESQVLKLVVGQSGAYGTAASSGGGGSFVVQAPYNTLNSALIVAGGGAGSEGYGGSDVQARANASLTPNGKNGWETVGPTNAGAGGTNGGGGGTPSQQNGGGGGAGLLGDGEDNANWNNPGGIAFINGAKGASGTLPGGFGGGGAAAGKGAGGGAGGGGGYSGGGGGDNIGGSSGGGGGSITYGNGINRILSLEGANKGTNGKIIITKLN